MMSLVQKHFNPLSASKIFTVVDLLIRGHRVLHKGACMDCDPLRGSRTKRSNFQDKYISSLAVKGLNIASFKLPKDKRFLSANQPQSE